MTNQSFLLDSHVAIWSIQDRGQLKTDVITAIEGPLNRIFVSAAAVWEIAIKRASGRLHVPLNFIELIESAGYAELAVTFRHAEVAANLPLLHRDPFDRMMIAQAQVEGLTLVTDDSMITRYNVPTLAPL